jgi:ketosteroid isomerase-like protein
LSPISENAKSFGGTTTPVDPPPYLSQFETVEKQSVLEPYMRVPTTKWTVYIIDAESGKQAIRSMRMQSNEAIARHDTDSLKSFLTDDYVITIGAGMIQHSRDEHARSFASHFSQYPDVVYVRTPTEISISKSYPLAIEEGTWVGSRTAENGKLENGGKYTAAWKKTSDGWRIYSELFVTIYCRGKDC